MDIRRAFIFVFTDPHWPRKLTIAFLLSLVPAGVWLVSSGLLPIRVPLVSPPLHDEAVRLAFIPVLGFELHILRRVVAGTDAPLPEWSDASGIIRDGLKAWLVGTVWYLPSTLAHFVDGGPLGLRVLVQLVGIAVFIIEPAARARLATTGSVGAGLDVGAALRTVRHNIRGYLLLPFGGGVPALIALGLSTGAVRLVWGVIGGQPDLRDVFTVGIAIMFVIPLPRWAIVHLEGQVYQRALGVPTLALDLPAGRGGEPVAGSARRVQTGAVRPRRR